MRMTTAEKLLVQIFERKNSIIERVKQQTDLYSQHLASKLLVEGINPPSWLWNPDSLSDSKGPDKEELISKILCPNPKSSVQYSVAKFPSYDNLVFTGDHEGFSHGISVGDAAFNEVPDRVDDPDRPAQRVEDQGTCALKFDFVPDSRKKQMKPKSSDHNTGTSDHNTGNRNPAYIKPKKEPQSYSKLIETQSIKTRSLTRANKDSPSDAAPKDLTDDPVSDAYDSQELSLASIHRSKSRQRALEIRNSIKRLPESRLSHKEINDACSKQRKLALSSSNVGKDDELLKLTGPCVSVFQSYESCDLDEANFLSREMENVSDPILDVKGCEEHVGQALLSAGLSVTHSQQCRESSINDAGQTNSSHLKQIGSVDVVPDLEITSHLSNNGFVNSASSNGRSPQHVNDFNEATGSFLSSVEVFSKVMIPQTHCNSTSKSGLDSYDEILKLLSPSVVDEPHLSPGRPNFQLGKGTLHGADEQNGTVFVLTAEGGIASQENARQSGISCSFDACGRDDKEQSVALAPSEKSLLLDPVNLRCEKVDECSLQGTSFTMMENITSLDGLACASINQATVYNHSRDLSDISDKGENLDRNPFQSDVHENTGYLLGEPLLETKMNALQDCKNSDLYEREPSPAQVQKTLTSIEDEASIVCEEFPPGDMACSTGCSLSENISESWSQPKRRKIDHQYTPGFGTFPSFQVKKSQRSQGGFTVPSLGNRTLGIEEKNEEQKNKSYVVSHEKFRMLIEETKKSLGFSIEKLTASNPSSDSFDARRLDDVQVGQRLSSPEPSDSQCFEESAHVIEVVEGSKSPDSDCGIEAQHLDLSVTNINPGTDAEQSVLQFEEFLFDTLTVATELDFAAVAIDLDKLNLPMTIIERASVLAEMCRSASMVVTPSTHFASSLENEATQELFSSIPSGNLHNGKFGSSLPVNFVVGNQPGKSRAYDNRFSTEGMPSSGSSASMVATPSTLFASSLESDAAQDLFSSIPNGNLHNWEFDSSLPVNFLVENQPGKSPAYDNRFSTEGMPSSGSKYGLSSKSCHGSPLRNLQERLSSHSQSSEKRLSNPELTCFPIEEDPTDIEENYEVECEDDVQEGINSSLGDFSDKRRPLEDLTNFRNSTKEFRQTRNSIDNSIIEPASSHKSSLKRQDQSISFGDSMGNNIVTHIRSFLPLIPRNQPALPCAGKREVKVKALEAAEAAKRLEEKRKNERRLKKEALKLERAKFEEKNLRQMEMKKKKREEELKKKEAELIEKKRIREEEEEKKKENKRLRLQVLQRRKEQEEKSRAKLEKGKHQLKDDNMNRKKELQVEAKKNQKRDVSAADNFGLKKVQPKLIHAEVVLNSEGSLADQSSNAEIIQTVDKTPKNESMIGQNGQRISYEISPYQCSDDEEDEDEITPKKFIPSWARKDHVAVLLSLQQNMDPDIIFPRESFCNMDEVLIPPRK